MLHIGSDSVCKPHFENKTIIFGPFWQLRVKKNEYFRAAFVGVFFSTFFRNKIILICLATNVHTKMLHNVEQTKSKKWVFHGKIDVSLENNF